MKVAVIDDDHIFQHLMKRLLSKLGVSDIVFFSDGEEAAEYFQTDLTAQDLPQIIFLDLNMPIMDGWNFLDAYQQIKLPELEHIPIYILSSSKNPKDLEKAKEYPIIFEFLSKPPMRQKLNAIFEQLKSTDAL